MNEYILAKKGWGIIYNEGVKQVGDGRVMHVLASGASFTKIDLHQA